MTTAQIAVFWCAVLLSCHALLHVTEGLIHLDFSFVDLEKGRRLKHTDRSCSSSPLKQAVQEDRNQEQHER